MNDFPKFPWPPLITDARVPRLIVWRDRLLTLGMWVLLIILARDAVLAMIGEVLDFLGRETKLPDLTIMPWVEQLEPYFVAALLLGAWLFGWGLVALRRLRAASRLARPKPLTATEEATRWGIDPAVLPEWRSWPVVVVNLDADGRITCERGDPPTAH